MYIQNTSTFTGDKLKIKFSSLKLTRPPDEFVIFHTRPKDFIVVSDDLTTANMDPWYCVLLTDLNDVLVALYVGLVTTSYKFYLLFAFYRYW